MNDDTELECPPRRPPTWFTLTIAGALCLVAATGVLIWYEARSECRQTVEFRRDNRAMWVELFETFPDAAAESGLQDDLETLQPPLRCDGGTPVIDTGETP